MDHHNTYTHTLLGSTYGSVISFDMIECSFFFCSVTQGGKKGKAGEGLLQWDSERERVLQVLIQLLQLDIRSLWNLSLVEEEFVRY